MAGIDVSIVVTSFNTREKLINCLDSIHYSIRDVSYEIVCVDDHSSDGSPEMVREKFPEVKLVVNKNNIGYSKSNNRGIKLSQGRYVVLLNADTVIKVGAFDKMVTFMDQHPEAGACGPKLLNPDGSLQYPIRPFPNPILIFIQSIGLHKVFPNNSLSNRYYLKNLDYDKVMEVESLGTTCYMIRREVFENVGYLDESYFMYVVDFDYNKRLNLAGYKVYYYPKAKVIHFGGLSVNQNAEFHLKDAHKGYRIFFDKFYAPNHNRIYNLLIKFAINLRLWIFLIRLKLTQNDSVVDGG